MADEKKTTPEEKVEKTEKKAPAPKTNNKKKSTAKKKSTPKKKKATTVPEVKPTEEAKEPTPVVEVEAEEPTPVVEIEAEEPTPVVEVKAENPAPVVEVEAEEPTPVVEVKEKPKTQAEIKADAKAEKEKAKALEKNEKEAEKAAKAQAKKMEREHKQHYGEIMTTSSFLGALVLMLIPGLNVILVIFWALGAAKNKNKVHFTRAAILFFIIEILITAILAGAGYIYLDQKETDILNAADNYTNGLLTYFDIDSYKDLGKLKNIPDYLVDKNPAPEPIKPETRVIENPTEITSYDQFMELYNAQQVPVGTTVTEGTEPVTTLNDILIAHDIDIEKEGLVYIVIENKENNCVIAFDPTGDMTGIPSVRIDNKIIYVGGVK